MKKFYFVRHGESDSNKDRNDSGGDPHLLYANRYGDGRWLNAYGDRPDRRWLRGDGFAFAVSEVDLNS